MLELYIRTVDKLNEYIGRLLAWCLPLMTIITLAIVLLAAVFRAGWVWHAELVVYMHGILFMLAGGYTLLHDGHVRIDVLYRNMSPVGKAWVNLLGVFFLLLPCCVVIFVYSFPYVADSWAVMEHSQERQGLPAVFLLKTCLLIMPCLLIMQGLALAAKSYLHIRAAKYPVRQ